MRTLLVAGVIATWLSCSASAQETVFNVPSADVLSKGKVYGELDITYQASSAYSTFTPRFVIGVGDQVELGLNANGFGVPGEQCFTPALTLKWKAYQGEGNGWALLGGDDVYIPVQNRTYNAGNYFWTEAAHAWTSGTRATFGVYHVSANVVANKQLTGAQLAVEQQLNHRTTVATDWFSGHSGIGYLTVGLALKVSRQFTWYGAYQLGNRGLSEGNHQVLTILGWNFN